MDFYRIACPEAFRTHPARAWGFYGHRLNLYRQTEPHAGLQVLKRWGQAMHHGYAVFTSNVDGQFQKAGFDQDAIDDCHGSLHHLQCLQCLQCLQPCSKAISEATAVQPEVDEAQCLLLNAAPTCPRCGGLATPNVLMFTDFEWLTHRQRVQARRMENWLAGVQAPVVVEIGAGTAIPSAREFQPSFFMIDHATVRLPLLSPRYWLASSGSSLQACGLSAVNAGASNTLRTIPTNGSEYLLPLNLALPMSISAMLRPFQRLKHDRHPVA